MNEKWILCPVCGNKTRTRVRADTKAENLPVFCPKCKRTSVLDLDGEKAWFSNSEARHNANVGRRRPAKSDTIEARSGVL